MSDLVLGSTTVLSDSSGTPTIQNGVGLPSGSLFTSWNASFIWLILGINLFLLKLETLKS